MQTIRGIFLIVSSFIMSIGSVLQGLTNTNQSLSIVIAGSFLKTHTLNLNSKSGSDTGLSFKGKMILCTSLMFYQIFK